jgi:hypothetical protein
VDRDEPGVKLSDLGVNYGCQLLELVSTACLINAIHFDKRAI